MISQGTYTGSCATGLSCVNGACSSSNSSTITTTPSPSSNSSSSNTTTCNANAGDVCEDTTYNITKSCCSPYTCETVSGSNRTKTCQGLSLALNQTCFAGGVVSVGPAFSPVLTLTAGFGNLRLGAELSGRDLSRGQHHLL